MGRDGSPPPNKINWTPRRLQLLRRHWEELTARELANKLRLHITVVRMKCYELGLRRFTVYHWTPPQVAFLKRNYRRLGDIELAEMLTKRFPGKSRWTEKHIRKKRCYLNLHRTASQIAAIRRRNASQGRYSNVSKRWDKTGRAPLGELRLWYNSNGYRRLFVKTRKGWTPYLRWLYQQKVGPIPRGKLVSVKDGNQLNPDIDNLILVNRRHLFEQNRMSPRWIAAHMAKGPSHTIDHDLKCEILKHPELIALKRKQLELERLIHDQQKIHRDDRQDLSVQR